MDRRTNKLGVLERRDVPSVAADGLDEHAMDQFSEAPIASNKDAYGDDSVDAMDQAMEDIADSVARADEHRDVPNVAADDRRSTCGVQTGQERSCSGFCRTSPHEADRAGLRH